MGNCLRRESDIIWGGDNWGSPDEWGSPESEKLFRKNTRRSGWMREEADPDDEEDEMLLGLGEKKKKKTMTKKTGVGVPCADSTEVKIKVTKKQLEELVEMADVQELSVQQMVSHQRAWRPALQSIPE